MSKLPLARFVFAAPVASLLLAAGLDVVKSEPASTKPAAPDARPAATPLPEPPLPVQQAQGIGLGQCTSMLDAMSRQTLTSRYEIQSGWSRADPEHHVFQSVMAVNNPANTPPDGLIALIAAPTAPGSCDGVAVQIFPVAGDCPSAQKTLLKDGKILGPLLEARIMADAHGNRVFLLPAFNHTCIAVAVDSHFGQM